MTARSSEPDAVSFKAKWIVPIIAPPVRNSWITVQSGKIVAIGREPPPSTTAVELGNVAITPGLCNAHTHLEFSKLMSPIPASSGFADWVRQVVALRRERPELLVGAVDQGIAESAEAGVTLIGEIAQGAWTLCADDGVSSVVAFRELIAPTTERAATAESLAQAFVANSVCHERVQLGLSPHAPYTVLPSVLRAIVQLSKREKLPVAMHLAETREELELMSSHEGPLQELLMAVGAWEPQSRPLNQRPLDYLRILSGAHRVLVIHGNYLDDEEISFLANSRSSMTVVYCPRTHAYFGHNCYPLEQLLNAGVAVAIGTDSRASNPDLSLLAELKFIAERFPKLSGDNILKLGTLGGATALGVQHRLGSLAPGYDACLAAIELPEDTNDPVAAILMADSRVVGKWFYNARSSRGVFCSQL